MELAQKARPAALGRVSGVERFQLEPDRLVSVQHQELLVPPEAQGPTETALVTAVADAVLDWAVLDREEEPPPASETINVPSLTVAELIGRQALAQLKSRGFRLVAGEPEAA